VAIGGLSGTGKSTLAYGLAPALGVAPGARVLRSDVIRKRLAGVAPEARLPNEAYLPHSARQVYDILGAGAAGALAAGHTVIADAVFSRPEERDLIAAAARAAGVPFTGLWLEAPTEVLEARVSARQGDASDATVDVLRRQLRYELGTIDWTRIDVSGDPSACLAAAQAALG
jgi:predicted kinase